MKKIFSVILSILIITSAFAVSSVSFTAAAAEITYNFSGSNADKAGYAEGTITLTAPAGTYWLYWADDSKALDGYYKIAKLSVTGASASHKMYAQTAVPADATKLIAIKSDSEPTEKTVSSASAVYNVPSDKLLGRKSSERKYRFASYSDVHIDGVYSTYKYADVHWEKALNTADARGAEFMVLSGDYVNNNVDYSGISTKEWKIYQKILANSNYCNPIYEAIGNHELWQDVKGGTADFIKATGLEDSKSSADKAYFEKTLGGDHFIFMSMEGGFYPDRVEEFSDEQLNWLEGLLSKYSGDGKNIYIVEHSLFYKYGAGDKIDGEPYYDIPLKESQDSTKRFKGILEKYKDTVFISGHTHIAFDEQYNYSDNNGTSAQMIHNSSVGGVRHVKSDGTLDRDYREDDTEGYIVDVFDNSIIFNGANLYYNMYDPNCCYIIKTSKQIYDEQDETKDTLSTENTSATAAPTTASSSKSTAPSTTTQSPYYLKGTFNSWGSSNPFYYTNESGLLSTTMKLNKGTYTFKINTSSTWYGNAGKVDDTTKKTSQGGWVFDTSSGDCTLNASGGYYTFTFNTSTKKVNIYYDTTDPYATEPTEAATTEAPTTVIPTETQTTETTEVITTQTTEPVTDKPTEVDTTEETEKPTEKATEEETSEQPEPEKTSDTEILTEETTQPETNPDTEIIGDVNGDLTVNIKDATLIQKKVAKLVEFDETQERLGDVNFDKAVNIKDATLIQKKAAGLISEFGERTDKEDAKTPVSASVLEQVKANLDLYYRYSSYDCYQALKKEYFKQKDSSTPDNDALTSLQDELLKVVDPENVDGKGDVITVYFENTNSWSTVNAYVWGNNGTGPEKAWPGNEMSYVGKNEYNHSIYKYTVDMEKNPNIIFNNGGSYQTKDIVLTNDSLCYYLSSSSSPYTVTSYAFKDKYIVSK